MKKIIILLAFLTIGSLTLLAQGPPSSPPATGNNGGSNGVVGGSSGSAPIGNGTFILFALAVAYAGR
ncbi:MAG: hypothetical protein WCM93_14070, partial [Bacteroidota bacterium]